MCNMSGTFRCKNRGEPRAVQPAQARLKEAPAPLRFTNADNIGKPDRLRRGLRLTLEALARYTNSGLAKPDEHLHEDIAAHMFEVAKRNAWR
jgi:hypothetical protein